MARCFCGCDEPVKGFAARGHNKQGRRTVEQVEKLTALKARSLTLAEESEELGEFLPGTAIAAHGAESVIALNQFASTLDEMLSIGEDYADTWHAILHDGYLPIEGVMAYKRSWLEWGKGAMSASPLLKYSDEKMIGFVLVAANYEGEV